MASPAQKTMQVDSMTSYFEPLLSPLLTSFKLQWTFGQERIPNNWYRRNNANLYNVALVSSDFSIIENKYPVLRTKGCNQGRVNSYTALDPSALTSGVYTAVSAIANPGCYFSQVLNAKITSLFGLSSSQIQQLQTALRPLTSQFGNCPQITRPNFTQLLSCPGYSTWNGPTAPKAPGAISS